MEAVQLLYTAWWLLVPTGEWRNRAPYSVSGRRGYNATHKNHPTAVWVRTSRMNYLMCADYSLNICKEYTKRFGREHACQIHAEWLRNNIPPISEAMMTPIPLVVKEDVVRFAPTLREAVREYRKFYKTKMFLRYRYSERPSWFPKIK